MKKIIFSVAVIAAATFGVIKANQNNVVLSDLSMENIEALGQCECPEAIVTIGRLCCTSLPGCCDYGGGDEFDGQFV